MELKREHELTDMNWVMNKNYKRKEERIPAYERKLI